MVPASGESRVLRGAESRITNEVLFTAIFYEGWKEEEQTTRQKYGPGEKSLSRWSTEPSLKRNRKHKAQSLKRLRRWGQLEQCEPQEPQGHGLTSLLP